MRSQVIAMSAAIVGSVSVGLPGCVVKFEDWALVEEGTGGGEDGEAGLPEGGEGGGGDPLAGAGGTGVVATGGLGTDGGGGSGSSATGGVEMGGSDAGGAEFGGTESGGSETGGLNSGGTESGGVETGGAPTGGVETGGAPTGGVETGGAPTGGVVTGGASVGGTGGTGGGGAGSYSTGVLTLGYADRTSGSSGQQLSFVLTLQSEGGDPIDMSAVTIRYWFTDETGQDFAAEFDYVSGAFTSARNVDATFGEATYTNASHYVEFSFGEGRLVATASTESMLQIRIHTGGYDTGTFNQENDYSFGDADRIAVYLDGELVWGVPPT